MLSRISSARPWCSTAPPGLANPLLPGESDAAWIARFGANRLMAHLKAGATAQAALKAALADAERSFKGLQRPRARRDL